MVERLFLAVPWGCLRFVIVVFHDHTHLLFFYINDLPDNMQHNVCLFAGDTAVYLTVQGKEDGNILQDNLSILQEWEKTWHMEFNTSKCQIMHISRSRRPIRPKETLKQNIWVNARQLIKLQ